MQQLNLPFERSYHGSQALIAKVVSPRIKYTGQNPSADYV